MKFFTATTLFYLASSSLAANTAVSTVGDVVASLQATLPQYDAALNTGAAQIANSVSASVLIQVESALNANLSAIASAIESAADSVAAVTINAAGGITAATAGLVQADVDALTAAIQGIIKLLTDIRASIILIVQANANVKQAIDAELSAVEAAVQPFVAPVVTLATTATAKVVVGLGVTGLAAAEAGLIAIASSLAATIA